MDINNLSRRDFLKKTGKTALAGAAALGFGSLKGCATAPPTVEISVPGEPVIYPPLPEGKIQPPKEGCWIGFHPFSDQYFRELGKHAKLYIDLIGNMDMGYGYQENVVTAICNTGALPVYYMSLTSFYEIYAGLGSLLTSKDFKESVQAYARDIVKVGKKTFLTTMREMNLDWNPWGKQPDTFKKVWRLMHNICRDEGANELATWFWEPYCRLPGDRGIGEPERYWPGDTYVDYIGLSCYSRDCIPSTANKGLEYLSGRTVHFLHKNHKDTPIIFAEFGRTIGAKQAGWLANAFRYIKKNQAIKGAIYWNTSDLHLGDNLSLHEWSFQYMRELFAKDPYFILSD